LTPNAVALVAVSCVFHAGWNLIAKRHLKDTTFFWWVLAVVAVIGAPGFIVISRTTVLPAKAWGCLAVSGAFMAVYFYCLGRAYADGDLTLVYPIARSAPLFVALWGFLFLRESLGVVGLAGILAATFGAFLLPIERDRRFSLSGHLKTFTRPTLLWAIATALATSGYSLVDKIGMSVATGLDEVYLYVYAEYAVGFVFLCLVHPGAWRQLRRSWRVQVIPATAVALGTLASYFLVLLALRSSKVSYVVAFRQLSVLLGTLFALVILRERGLWRVIGAAVITAGLVALTLAK